MDREKWADAFDKAFYNKDYDELYDVMKSLVWKMWTKVKRTNSWIQLSDIEDLAIQVLVKVLDWKKDWKPGDEGAPPSGAFASYLNDATMRGSYYLRSIVKDGCISLDRVNKNLDKEEPWVNVIEGNESKPMYFEEYDLNLTSTEQWGLRAVLDVFETSSNWGRVVGLVTKRALEEAENVPEAREYLKMCPRRRTTWLRRTLEKTRREIGLENGEV